MATSDAVLLFRVRTTVTATAAQSSDAVGFVRARLVSGAYTPQVNSTSSGSEAWRPRAGSPIGYVVVGGQRLPVMPDPAWSKWFDTMADRIGGPNGVRVPDVVATVEASQTTSAETAQRTQALAQQAAANAASIAAAREVLQNAALPGASQIPPPVLDGGNYQVP